MGDSSYDGCAAVVLGGLESSIELGEPVDAASEGEVVQGGSSHCVGYRRIRTAADKVKVGQSLQFCDSNGRLFGCFCLP